MKRDVPPEGMALMQSADSRWFPAFTTFSALSQRVYVEDESPALIPPALAPFHDPAQGYSNREEAIEACRSLREEVELYQEWRGLAARTEIYPERSAWYFDEIAHLVGENTPRPHCGISSHAVVFARQTTGNNGTQIIATTSNTPGEAIETLYQHVYEWAHSQQTPA